MDFRSFGVSGDLGECSRYPLTFIDYASSLALLYLSFPFHRSISISLHVFIYFIPYVFYCFHTMRGRPFVVVVFLVSAMLNLCHAITLDLSITCYYLTRPLCCTMTYPDYYPSLVMFYCLLYITTLSCYLLKPSMIHLTL